MKRNIPALCIILFLSACNGWVIQPLPNNPPTPFMPFTPTPSIFTQTPVIIGVTSASATPVVFTSTPVSTDTPGTIVSLTPTSSATVTHDPIGNPAISIKVLGCNTSIDVTHGMGEVTNAFVTLTNSGNVELTNIKVTLIALDEGREHPDKTVELTSLPVGQQVTIKLTVDTTFQKDTPIQVTTTTDQRSFPLEGLGSCTDIGLFAPNPNGLNTPVPAIP